MPEQRSRQWIWLVPGLILLGGIKFGFSLWEKIDGPRSEPSYQALHRLSDLEGFLHLAKVGDVDGVRRMMAKGISINSANVEGETALSMALRGADNPVTPFCLSAGFVPTTEYQDASGGTGFIGDVALYWAAREGRSEVVRKLLQTGALADGPRDHNGSALAIAVAKGRHEIIQLLVKAGADHRGVFIYDDGNSARPGEVETLPLICFPLRTHDLATLRQLLALKFSTQPLDFNSALETAVTVDWPEAVSALLDAGADPDETGMDDKPFDHWAKSDTVRGLLQAARAASHFPSLATADERRLPEEQFIRTLFLPDSTAAAALIAKLPINVLGVRDDRGWTSLMYALQAGKPELMSALIQKGVPLDALAADGRSVAGMATETNHRDVLELLAKNGANLNSYGPQGMPPLSIALARRNADLAIWLLDHGAAAEPSGSPVRTPLMWALRNQNEPLVRRLLDGGAQVKQRDANGWPVVYYAALSGVPELVELIEHRGVSLKNETNLGGPLLKRAVVEGDLGQIRVLLEIGVSPTAEIVGEAVGQTETLDLLDESSHRNDDTRARANVYWSQVKLAGLQDIARHLDAKNDQNFASDLTPLQWAAQTARTDVVGLLLERGAGPNRLGTRNRTPALITLVASDATGDDHARAALIKMLADHGADLNLRSSDGFPEDESGGRTVLMICAEHQFAECAELLLKLGADINVRDAAGKNAIDHLQPGAEKRPAGKALRELLVAAEKKRNRLQIEKKSSPERRL